MGRTPSNGGVSVCRFQRGAEVVDLGLKFPDPRELHSQSALNTFELLGDSGEDVAELGNEVAVLSWRASGTPQATGTTRATRYLPTGHDIPLTDRGKKRSTSVRMMR